MKVILTQKLIKENYEIKLSKYVSTFNYTDKILIVLNVMTGGLCIISYVAVVGTPVGLASPRFTILFAITTVKNLANMSLLLIT